MQVRGPALGFAILAIAACASSRLADAVRPRSPADALRLVLARTCLPYVADDLAPDVAAERAELGRDWVLPPVPGVSHETGRRYRSSWPGLRSVQLHGAAVGEGARAVRSCSFTVRGARDDVLQTALEEVLRARAPELVAAADVLPGPRTFRVPGALVASTDAADMARWGEKEVDVYADPSRPAP